MLSECNWSPSEHWKLSDCAIIGRAKDKHGEGSNMILGFPIVYDGVVWNSSESLYQAARFVGKLDTVVDGSKTLFDLVNDPVPMIAKRNIQPYLHLTRTDWKKQRVRIMEGCLLLKTLQNRTRILAFLDETHSMPIVEKSSSDTYWGAVPKDGATLVGHNILGQLWMKIRHKERNGYLPDELSFPIFGE